MNVFVLCTGRCGSKTFSVACQHIMNYTAAHESRVKIMGPERLNYPEDHIEVDNRLSWFLGRLDGVYGDDAFYVHLMRRTQDTVESFRGRYNMGIMRAYGKGIYPFQGDSRLISTAVCQDYIYTVTENIRLFLRDRTLKMPVFLETAKRDFKMFWDRIGAEGDLDVALREWDHRYNASGG